MKSAIRFLRANAEKYGYDPERFAIWGESAGGYLSVICGASNDEEFNSVPFIGEDENHPVSSEVQVINTIIRKAWIDRTKMYEECLAILRLLFLSQ